MLLLLQVGGSCSQHSQHYSHSRNSLGCNYGAVIGSLPRGLSRDERQVALQSAPPASPALGALLQMPRVRTAAAAAAAGGGSSRWQPWWSWQQQQQPVAAVVVMVAAENTVAVVPAEVVQLLQKHQ
jgi:hypothetical protein